MANFTCGEKTEKSEETPSSFFCQLHLSNLRIGYIVARINLVLVSRILIHLVVDWPLQMIEISSNE